MEHSRLPDRFLTIVPQPPPPGLYVTLGPDNLVTWALESVTRSFSGPSRILWVDAANAFNAYLVAMAARAGRKDPTLVLRSYQVARPFTAYQLETMITEKALPVARRFNVLFIVIADPLRLFADAQGRDTQVRQCYSRFILGLKALALETAVLVLNPVRPSRYEAQLFKAAMRLTQLQFIDHKPTLSVVSRSRHCERSEAISLSNDEIASATRMASR